MQPKSCHFQQQNTILDHCIAGKMYNLHIVPLLADLGPSQHIETA